MTTITKAGRYELREELGRGAMGVVYHGHDPVIGREVAVKTMHLSSEGTGMSREELIARFQTEARAAGLLTHPNIVVVYDAGEEEGIFYITMEMVQGRSLQALLDARQSFPLARVMKLMEQVCSALDFAHQHNVVHRDIKPANLVLTPDDTVKITDFGTAKILQFGTAQTAHVMGTPSYMSPEQVKGKPVDGRSDIFSLGVILYELMTGEKPFPGQNITTVIYKIINEEPIPPRTLDPSIHQGLSAVITRALAKDPDTRFQNCHELLDALKNFREMMSPDATVRALPPQTLPLAGTARPSVPAASRPVPLSSVSRATEIEAPVRFVSQASIEEEESAKTRSRLLLTLILLAIIGYAGYRIYPPMVDLWKRAHEPAEKIMPPSGVAPAAPAANSESPDTEPEEKPEAVAESAPPAPAAAPEAAEAPIPYQAPQPTPKKVSSDAPRQVAQAAPPEKPISAEMSPSAGKVAEAVATPTPASLTPTPAAIAAETRLQSELARLALAEKVKVQASANTVTLSGRLTPTEHRMLLNRLHWVPTAVRIVDDLEYSDNLADTAGQSSSGWVWVRSDPQGAEIFLDGADTGLRTPARVEMQRGNHAVRLMLGGFLAAERAVSVRSGQTMQFTEVLDRQ